MALSPADFYAYSRATGVPIPEDPEEKVQMAPEVIEFRRNQLKSPQQDSNPLATLGTAALGLGALAGLGFGAKALMGRGRQLPKGPAKSATAGVRQVNLADMEGAVRRVAAEPDVPASKVPPSDERSRVYAEVAAKPESELPRVYRPKGGLEDILPEERAEELNVLITDPNTGEIFRRGQSPESFAQTYISLRPELTGQKTNLPLGRTPSTFKEFSESISLTDIQKTQALANSNQFINAVESGEDQLTGRVIKQINIADPWGEATIPPAAINEQQSVPLLPSAAVSPREQAQQFLQSKFEELGATIPGRYRRERAMGMDPEIAEAIELYASTGDPAVLSRLSKTPSSPVVIQPRVQTELVDETISTGKFFQPTGQGEFIDDLFEKDINLTNRISELGVQKQQIVNRLEEIDQLEPQLRFAAADEPGQGGYYTRLLNKMMFEKQSLDPNSVNVDLGDLLAERNYVRQQMESLESLGTKYKPIKRQEGLRPFFEVDPVTGEPIAETLEIRTGRPSVAEGTVTEPAGGSSIRGVSSMETYGGDLLSSEGIYGTERSFAGASAYSPETGIPPSASPSAWRLPAGSRSQNKQNINIVVAGGREYENYPELSQVLDRVISELNVPSGMGINIVSGGARGADTLAEKYAQEKGYGLQVFPADWKTKGLSAGMQRNKQMASAGDVLVAFPGGTGTENMIQQMTQDFGKPAYRASDLITPTPEQVQKTKESLALSEFLRRGAIEGYQVPTRTIQGPRQATEKKYQYPQSFLTEKPESSPAVASTSGPVRLAQPMQGPKTPPVQGPKVGRTARVSYENSPLTPEEQFIAALELEAEKQKMAPEDVILKTMATTPSKIKRSEQRLPGPAYLSAYAKQRGYF